MSRVFGARLLPTLFALGSLAASAAIALGFAPGAEFSARLVHLRDGLYVVHATQQSPLPQGLRAGDIIPIHRLSPTERAAMFDRHDVLPGTALTLPVIRDGKLAERPVAPVPDRMTMLLRAEFLGFQSVAFAIAMLTLWRGRDWAAWGLSVVFLLALFAAGPLQVPLPVRWAFWQHQTRLLANEFALVLAMFAMADSLAGASLPSRWRTAARVATALVVLAMFGSAEILYTALIRTGVTLLAARGRAINLMLFGTFITVTLSVLLAGYRYAAHGERLRIRWVLWSTALLFGSDLLQFLTPRTWQADMGQVVTVLQGIALLGYLYAVLRTRLIDVGFVVDRALVFGLLTALVFGTFSILEQALHQFAISERVGWALQALAALVLALVLSPLHRRLESWIEQAFFRSQRLALLALERFARECPFVEREAHLLAMAIERLKRQCAAVAVYERAGSSYRRRAASDESWPAVIDADDPVFVAMRASREPVALAAQANRIGAEGLALPMTVAESLLGALICRPRDGEQFAPEIRAALANVAHHLGMALTGLRHREHARLVADVAAGRIDPDAARRRAITLLEGELPPASLGASP
ncbi:MAG: hypothetical protein ACP5PN_05555 [Steroidobacteraceae bacterium]